MDRDDLVVAIMAEINRIWGEPGFGGDAAQYAWLERTYGVTEAEDVRWIEILDHWGEDSPEEDLADEELMALLEDDGEVIPFLTGLLAKYRSADVRYAEAR